MEAQRGKGACPRSHSQMAESECDPKPPCATLSETADPALLFSVPTLPRCLPGTTPAPDFPPKPLSPWSTSHGQAGVLPLHPLLCPEPAPGNQKRSTGSFQVRPRSRPAFKVQPCPGRRAPSPAGCAPAELTLRWRRPRRSCAGASWGPARRSRRHPGRTCG